MIRTAANRLGCAIMLAGGIAGPAQADELEGWRVAGRVGEVALVATALGKSAAEEDWKGAGQLGLGLGATWLTTEGLKRLVESERPNGRDDRSFPSGHTSISFSAASYLHVRYGWEWGAPALVAAGLVGWTRVEAHEHRWEDVVAGAAIGTLSAHLLASPRDAKVRLLPWGDTKGGGVVARLAF